MPFDYVDVGFEVMFVSLDGLESLVHKLSEFRFVATHAFLESPKQL